jgi:predicted ATPase
MEMVEQVEIAFRKEVSRSREIFIKHHFEKYDGKIPVWALVSFMNPAFRQYTTPEVGREADA